MRAQILICFMVALILECPTLAHSLRLTERNDPTQKFKPVELTQISNLPIPARSTNPRLGTISPQQKRHSAASSYKLASGWRLSLESTTQMLPIAIAAKALASFYRDIMIFAAQAGETAEDEVTDLTIQFGNMFLEFIASEELSPVSWDLVRIFAGKMLEMTENGFTGGYHAVMNAGASMIVVRIGLRA